MRRFIGKRTVLKALIFGLVLSAMCLLTFISYTPISAGATDVAAGGVTTSNEDTDDGSALSGNLGGLTFSFSSDGTGSLSATLQILLILTVISLAPSIIIMVTSFTRILIVLHFVRTALGTQTTPPNQVMIGLALFLTVFIMSPTINEVYNQAVVPMSQGEMGAEEAFNVGMEPIREFMFNQMDGSERELELFLEVANITDVKTRADVPTTVLIPAFILSELRIAFIIGFLIYIPFLIIDMVVSSTLMSMGMMMLPPTTISMPFKILLFIVADGWDLIIGEVVRTFY